MSVSQPPGDELKKSKLDPQPSLEGEIEPLVTGRGNSKILQQCLQAIRKSEQSGDKKKVAWAVFELAVQMRSQGQYANTIQVLEKTRTIFESIGDEIGLASTFEELSFSSRELSRNSLALEYSHQAINLLEKLDRKEELGQAYDNLAYVYFFVYRRHESLVYAQKARSIFRQLNSPKMLAWNSCNLGMIYLDMEFFEKAETHYSEAVKLFTHLNSLQGLSWALLGLATVHRAQCQFESSTRILEKALEIDKDAQPKDYAGWIILNQAALHRNKGEDALAFSANKVAVNLFGSIKNQIGVGWGLLQSGQILRDRGFLVKSWQTLSRSLDIFKDMTNKKGMGWGENEWGITHLELNNLSHARDCFIRATVLAQQVDSSALKAEVHKNLARLALDEGRLDLCKDLIEKAMGFAKRLEVWESFPELLAIKAHYHLIIGEIGKAHSYLNEAQEFVRKFQLVRFKPMLGVLQGEILFEEGDISGAVQTWMNTIELSNLYHQLKPRTQAVLGLIQAQWKETSSSYLSSMFMQIEKDLKVGSSRKQRAKYMMIKSLMVYFAKKIIDTKTLSQAIRMLDSTGLVLVKLQALQLLAEMNGNLKKDREKERVQKEIQFLLKSHSIDPRRLRPNHKPFDTLPVSLIL